MVFGMATQRTGVTVRFAAADGLAFVRLFVAMRQHVTVAVRRQGKHKWGLVDGQR